MKLGDVCPAPCFTGAPGFQIASPGCSAGQLKFASEGGRDYYSVLLRNHDFALDSGLNPKIAIVGLSPAGNQIAEFVRSYAATGSYAEATISAAFAGLSKDIIGMLTGLGVTTKLNLDFSKGSLARHPQVLVTSLVACASLTTGGSSDDFDPVRFPASGRCITKRFVGEVLDQRFQNLSHVFILGAKGWAAVNKLTANGGSTIAETLRANGKSVLNIPHPSGQNAEYVKLASLTASSFPNHSEYVEACWAQYKYEPNRPGRGKQPENEYRAKRLAYWSTIDRLRREIAATADAA